MSFLAFFFYHRNAVVMAMIKPSTFKSVQPLLWAVVGYQLFISIREFFQSNYTGSNTNITYLA